MYKKNTNQGFTLVEVAIAIALLGIGLMTLTAITTRLMNDTQEEINRTRASFYAQYILEITLADRFAQNGQAAVAQNAGSGSLYEKLSQIRYFEGIDEGAHSFTKNWTYDLKIENINLELAVPATYEKYALDISWGSGGDQVLHIETIKKAKENPNTATQEEEEDNE